MILVVIATVIAIVTCLPYGHSSPSYPSQSSSYGHNEPIHHEPANRPIYQPHHGMKSLQQIQNIHFVTNKSFLLKVHTLIGQLNIHTIVPLEALIMTLDMGMDMKIMDTITTIMTTIHIEPTAIAMATVTEVDTNPMDIKEKTLFSSMQLCNKTIWYNKQRLETWKFYGKFIQKFIESVLFLLKIEFLSDKNFSSGKLIASTKNTL